MVNTMPAVVAAGWPTWATVLIIVLVVVIALLIGLYVAGTKLQKRQIEQKEQMDAIAQTMSMLIIDKKVMRLIDAKMPDEVMSQVPKYMRKQKMPVVKAKVGPRIMTLLADPKVFEVLPVKKEAKVVVSGIYITGIKGSIQAPEPKKKKGLFGKKK